MVRTSLAKTLVTSILASSVLATTFPRSAQAEVYNCTPSGQTRGNYFDGMAAFNQPYNGVSALVTVRYGAVCDTDTTGFNPQTLALGNFNYAWTMIANSNTSTGGWMQSGFFRTYGSAMTDFSQVYDLRTGIHDVVGAVVQAGDTEQYWQQDINGTWYSNTNTTRMQSDTDLEYGWSGLTQQFFSESAYLSNDVPGGSGYETNMYSILVQNYSGTFVPIPNPFLSGYNNNPSRWGGPRPTGSQSFLVWTQNYN